MANAINLSKDWTLGRLLGILRVLANQISPDRIQDLELIDMIHLSICDIAELLSTSAYPDYGTLVIREVLTGDQLSLTDLRIDSITKLSDATNKLCIEVEPDEYENLITILQKQANVYWYLCGETIYLYKGPLTLGTMTLWYNRIPKKVTDVTDTVDMKDQYMKLVLDKTKIMTYETLKQVPPEVLTNSVNNSIAQIRQANMDERQAIQ